jgi:hypothetical protein
MHTANAEVIWILICTVTIFCFWRIILALLFCAIIGSVLIGLLTILGQFKY